MKQCRVEGQLLPYLVLPLVLEVAFDVQFLLLLEDVEAGDGQRIGRSAHIEVLWEVGSCWNLRDFYCWIDFRHPTETLTEIGCEQDGSVVSNPASSVRGLTSSKTSSCIYSQFARCTRNALSFLTVN